jgi:mycothiol synthase
MSNSIPQLHMRRSLAALPEIDVPSGYELRAFTSDDAARWADLLARNGELGEWNLDRALPFFAANSRMVLPGSFFVMCDGRPTATAQLHLHLDDVYAPTPELGWVAALPDHRGKGIGYLVCLAVLRFAASVGHQEIFLRTDDHRLPAIRSYLRLGFEPWLFDETARDRWDRIRHVLRSP